MLFDDAAVHLVYPEVVQKDLKVELDETQHTSPLLRDKLLLKVTLLERVLVPLRISLLE